MTDTRGEHAPALSSEEVTSLIQDLPDADIAAIVALQPSRAELDTALAWANLESDVMGEARRPLTGKIAEIYEILTRNEAFEEDR